MTEPAPLLTYRTKGGKFIVRLASRGNPDHGQDPDRRLPGVPSFSAHTDTIAEARDMCLQYISMFELGGGNWTGGCVTTLGRKRVGQIYYNGTFCGEEGV